MMLARVADSLYWMGRYAERAEHYSRLASVMLNAALDGGEAADQAVRTVQAAAGELADVAPGSTLKVARGLALGAEASGSVVACVTLARENARQVRDQITTETWEHLNQLYLRTTSVDAGDSFDDDSSGFLQRIIADLHLFKGAADATMSHGEGWRFMIAGIYIERTQLMARLLQVSLGGPGQMVEADHIDLINLLRMSCALEPYLRAYTADIRARFIVEFLLFNDEFPRSIHFTVARLEELLGHLSSAAQRGGADPLRLSGRLNARLTYADLEHLEANGAGQLLASVAAECGAIHQAIHDRFVAYPLETGLPA